MKLDHERRGRYLLIRAQGKLDASWSDHFRDTLMGHLRNGNHHLVVDAAAVDFLSSAGIRSLLQVVKALNVVHGSFRIVHPSPFVEQILTTAGFPSLLEEGPPEDMFDLTSTGGERAAVHAGIEHHPVEKNAVLTPARVGGWRPWERVDPSMCSPVSVSDDLIALGIGGPGDGFDAVRDRLGEYLAVAGNVVYQPPGEQEHPDYLVSEGRYVPAIHSIQCLGVRGEMGHLLRFAPSDETPFYTVSALMDAMLDRSGATAAGFVILGEIEGLVGASLIRSPGLLDEDRDIRFPEVRDWLTFCVERSYPRLQALMAGAVRRTSNHPGVVLLPALASRPGLAAHVHAAVFPFQPLPNGRIDLRSAVQAFFNGPPPLAVLHLVDDARPVVGLGESALFRGACWFGPIRDAEVWT